MGEEFVDEFDGAHGRLAGKHAGQGNDNLVHDEENDETEESSEKIRRGEKFWIERSDGVENERCAERDGEVEQNAEQNGFCAPGVGGAAKQATGNSLEDASGGEAGDKAEEEDGIEAVEKSGNAATEKDRGPKGWAMLRGVVG